jgi:hypothetical protein
MLGATQKAWFKNLLATSDAALLVWICASPWLDVRDDTWAAYPTERDELRDAFIQYGWMNRMCQVSGDYHAMAMDTGVGNRLLTGASFPVYIFSSLDSNALQAKLGMYDVGLEQGSYHYGTVRIDDDGSAVRVTATGHNRQGVWNVHEWQPPYEPAMSEPAPSARLYRSTNQVGVPNATDTPVSWNAEEFDSHGGHAPSANPTRYTALVPGQYLCIPRLHFAGAAGGSRRVWLRVNGKTAVRGSRNVEIPTGAGLSWPAQTSALVSLSAGHYGEVMAYQSSGAPLDLVGSAAASSSQCTFDIVYVRPLTRTRQLVGVTLRFQASSTPLARNPSTALSVALSPPTRHTPHTRQPQTHRRTAMKETAGGRAIAFLRRASPTEPAPAVVVAAPRSGLLQRRGFVA